jgi:hypothetical protein
MDLKKKKKKQFHYLIYIALINGKLFTYFMYNRIRILLNFCTTFQKELLRIVTFNFFFNVYLLSLLFVFLCVFVCNLTKCYSIILFFYTVCIFHKFWVLYKILNKRSSNTIICSNIGNDLWSHSFEKYSISFRWIQKIAIWSQIDWVRSP